jgi:hypothetical protein
MTSWEITAEQSDGEELADSDGFRNTIKHVFRFMGISKLW